MAKKDFFANSTLYIPLSTKNYLCTIVFGPTNLKEKLFSPTNVRAEIPQKKLAQACVQTFTPCRDIEEDCREQNKTPCEWIHPSEQNQCYFFLFKMRNHL